MKARRIKGINSTNLCEVDKKMNDTIAIPTYFPEGEFQHFSNAQRNKGKNAINMFLLVACHMVNIKKPGANEQTKEAENANRSSSITSLANKKVEKILKTPSNIQKNKIVYSIVIPVTCDRPERKNGDAPALDNGYIPVKESGCIIHPAYPDVDIVVAKVWITNESTPVSWLVTGNRKIIFSITKSANKRYLLFFEKFIIKTYNFGGYIIP